MSDAKLLYIAGNWVHGKGKPLATIDPATGNTLAHISSASEDQVDAAVAAARATLTDPDWRDLKPHKRARLLYAMGTRIDDESERLSEIQMRDNGKTTPECRALIASAADTFRYYAAVCETYESAVAPSRGDHWALSVFEPMGVVGAITPWNSPATLEAQKLAPILAAGNAVVLKSSELTPLIGLEYARIAEACGFPKGVISVIAGGADTGRYLVDHPDVDMITFTGGVSAGKAIAAASGANLKPVVLELGGKSPNIVFADADFEKAADGVADGVFNGAGQSCVAGSRVFIERSIYDAFIDALQKRAAARTIGMPDREGTKMGPLASRPHRDAVHRHVTQALEDGGKLLAGGEIPMAPELVNGAFYPATIIEPHDNNSRICQTEIFGPVATVLPFDEETDLVTMANDSDFGLAAGIWTGDHRRAWRVARAIQAGTVWINTYKQTSIAVPFGGFKSSGLGREKGIQGMLIYMQAKGIYWDT